MAVLPLLAATLPAEPTPALTTEAMAFLVSLAFMVFCFAAAGLWAAWRRLADLVRAFLRPKVAGLIHVYADQIGAQLGTERWRAWAERELRRAARPSKRKAT